MATPPANSQQVPSGALFDVPGIAGGSTQWTEQYESTQGLSTILSSTSQVNVTGIQQFKQVDVVCDWLLDFELGQGTALAWTAGVGQTLTTSQYAPFNIIGPVQLLIQNQYASVDVESGIDLYIFNLIRPYAKSNRRNNLYANPAGRPIGGTATGYPATGLAQANTVNAAQFTSASTAYKLLMRLPAAQWFDEYYDLAVTGEPLGVVANAIVSPQYMAGTTRNIIPNIRINPGLTTSTTDLAPVQTTAITTGTANTASTFTGANVLNIRRKAVYAGNTAVMPPVYAWQYRWKTQRYSLAGVSRQDLLLPNDTGQLLSVYVRLYDPAANTAVGGAIALSAVTRANLQYGSGLFWFDDANSTGGAYETQRKFLDQHGFLLPEGVLAWDLALDENDNLSNKRALNTLTTAGILVHLEFTGTQSSSAYAVLGTESLVYVT